jgi:dipeptidyl aminopeptidase/acylaminoacyl peptidase
MRARLWILGLTACLLPGRAWTAARETFGLADVFQLEWASDPQISPDGSRVVFLRNGFDVMTDRTVSNLWEVDADGGNLRPLTSGNGSHGAARFSPDGGRLLFVASSGSSHQLFARWIDTGQQTELTRVERPPRAPAWSPDGSWIAFQMFVPEEPPSIAEMPEKPEGADWGPPIKYIDQVIYREDGEGYVERGRTHLFVLPAEGGTPRQVTIGDWDDGPPSWSKDGSRLLFSSNRHEDREYDPANSEIWSVEVADGTTRVLTDRHGPDTSPVVSPDGTSIAYLGFDDHYVGYEITRLYVMNGDGSNARAVTSRLDRDVQDPSWSPDGRGIYFLYDEAGDTRIGYVSVPEDTVETISDHVGGLSLGRPYGGGQFSLSRSPGGAFAFTHTSFDHPADVAIVRRGEPARRLTRLNDDLLAHKELAAVEEIRYPSSFDKREIQGWIARPPGFDRSKKYPLLLEIHGGPYANYGARFAAEIQLYASAGYVVLYTNPRGSTGYGEEFGNVIHQDYPDHDYDDLMSGVDAAIARGSIDERRLFVTGGSGGGVLSAWIVGHTDRFRAAVVQKPVINWYSFVLDADGPPFFYKYWMPGFPWDHVKEYMDRSPISYVGNVKTPTMLITGEVDYRTPSSEAEQFYAALKLRHVDAAMVRIPDASHEIAAKPSNLVAKVAYVLGWFRKHDAPGAAAPATN